MQKKQPGSLKAQMVGGLLAMLIPLLSILIFSSFYGISLSNEKIAESNQRTLSFYTAQIEQDLDSVDDFLTALTARDGNFIRLSSGVGQLQAHLSSHALITQLQASLSSYPCVGAFFIYSATSNSYRDIFAAGESYEQKTEIQRQVRTMVEKNSISYRDGWVTRKIGGEAFLLRFYGGRSTYLIAMVPFSSILTQNSGASDTEATAVFGYATGQPVTQQELVNTNGLSLAEALDSKKDFIISGTPKRFMILGNPISGTDICLYLLVGQTGFLSHLNWVQVLLLVFSTLSIGLIPLSLIWIRRSLLRPLADIQRTIAAIRSGDLSAQVPTGSAAQEFQEVNDTFNSMMAQIQDLKIEAYEKELGRQKAELQYLQLQIRTHFFLNCLKCVYAAAQQKKYDRVQQLILSVSNHIRYIFQDKMDLVPLQRELDHIRNYIQIQRISTVNPPECEIDVPASLLSFPIPPLTLQTFVENSIKHETRPDYQLKLFIKASVLCSGEESYLDISVRDNGTGFSEEVLDEINHISDSIYTGHHVGLNNVRHRLRLLYGDQVMLAFYNSNPGSVSEVLIPYKPNTPREEDAQ